MQQVSQSQLESTNKLVATNGRISTCKQHTNTPKMPYIYIYIYENKLAKNFNLKMMPKYTKSNISTWFTCKAIQCWFTLLFCWCCINSTLLQRIFSTSFIRYLYLFLLFFEYFFVCSFVCSFVCLLRTIESDIVTDILSYTHTHSQIQNDILAGAGKE